jgi:hypothetical protein
MKPRDPQVLAFDTADSIHEFQMYLIEGSRRPDQAVNAIIKLESLRLRQLKILEELMPIIDA